VIFTHLMGYFHPRSATVIAYVMITVGPVVGLTAIVPELLGTAILLFVFFHQFDERLAT